MQAQGMPNELGGQLVFVTTCMANTLEYVQHSMVMVSSINRQFGTPVDVQLLKGQLASWDFSTFKSFNISGIRNQLINAFSEVEEAKVAVQNIEEYFHHIEFADHEDKVDLYDALVDIQVFLFGVLYKLGIEENFGQLGSCPGLVNLLVSSVLAEESKTLAMQNQMTLLHKVPKDKVNVHQLLARIESQRLWGHIQKLKAVEDAGGSVNAATYTSLVIDVLDAITCIHRVQCQLGRKPIDDMISVTTALSSRMCNTMEEVEQTQAMHRERGVLETTVHEVEGGKFVVRSAGDYPDAPEGKFLKGVNTKQPVFKEVD